MLQNRSNWGFPSIIFLPMMYNIRFPRYQRRYVWDQTNWRTLWEDILSQLDLGLDNETDGKIVVKRRVVQEHLEPSLEDRAQQALHRDPCYTPY